MFTVEDLCDAFISNSFQYVKLYDSNSGKIVYEGYADKIPDDYLYLEVDSIDNIMKDDDSITLNITVED